MYTTDELYEHCIASYYYENGQLMSIKYKRAVGSLNPTNGYLILNTYLGGKHRPWSVPVHRVIYLMHHKVLPPQIDHINRNKTDNRIDNLRMATQSEQNCNKGKRTNNTSGYTGVVRAKTGKWEARIGKHKKMYYLGTFNTPEEANDARTAALSMHGEFAVHA